MTGNIEELLLRSEAAKSLQMEANVAQAFRRNGWTADLGVYYDDPETGKPREIDVYVHKNYQFKTTKHSTSSLINLYTICECKSLGGYNILFVEGEVPSYGRPSPAYYWLGNDITTIGRSILGDLKISEPEVWEGFYDYASERAYPNNSSSLVDYNRVGLPPIGMVATTFRETKFAKVQAEDRSGRNPSPLWGAIQSTLSAVDASLRRAQEVGMEYVSSDYSDFQNLHDRIDYKATFMDMEFCRLSLVHPLIFVKCPLWKLTSDSVQAVSSVRLYVRHTNHEHKYVDIISYDDRDIYINWMTAHFDQECTSSVEATAQRIGALGWRSGQAGGELKKLLLA